MFLYRLALELGIWDVEQTDRSLKNQISAEQLKRWIAYYRVEPFGQAWRRSARAAITIAAAFGAKLTTDAEDLFLPGYDPNQPTQSESEMLAELAKLKALRKAD